MQILLTQEEYESLKSDQEAYKRLQNKHEKLLQYHKELDDKYTRLLIFGVYNSNERFKGKL